MDLLLLAEQLEQAVLVGTQEGPSSMGKEDLAIYINTHNVNEIDSLTH